MLANALKLLQILLLTVSESPLTTQLRETVKGFVATCVLQGGLGLADFNPLKVFFCVDLNQFNKL